MGPDSNPPPKNILIVRQDNIGDLVCTLPLIAGLRHTFPNASIEVLCTSYNRAILAGNPHVDAVHTYAKRAHHSTTFALIAGSLEKVLLIAKLRRRRFDVAIAASTPSRPRIASLIRMIRPATFIRSEESGDSAEIVPEASLAGKHEVERCWALGQRLGITGQPQAASIFPDPARLASLANTVLAGFPPHPRRRFVAVHISSRKPSQRWPAASFAAALRLLHTADPSLHFVILWAPGPANARGHEGDDQKAAELAGLLGDSIPAIFRQTPDLRDTIDAIASCRAFIGSDGGAMHVAAACGIPAIALFGASDATRWHPWAVPHEVLQPPSKNVHDVSPSQVAASLLRATAHSI
jgi:ADP-heptose:LPS heptosyltransferase